MLWRGDFHNARQLLAALAHRLDRRKQKRRLPSASPREAFNLYRLAQSQRARLLNSLLVQVDAHGSIALKRAPDVKAACASVLGDTEEPFLFPLRHLPGFIGERKDVGLGMGGAVRVDRGGRRVIKKKK